MVYLRECLVYQAARYAKDFSRPTTGDTMGAAAIEELFYKMHLMQQRIDEVRAFTRPAASLHCVVCRVLAFDGIMRRLRKMPCRQCACLVRNA